jgi:hypothetical protein
MNIWTGCSTGHLKIYPIPGTANARYWVKPNIVSTGTHEPSRQADQCRWDSGDRQAAGFFAFRAQFGFTTIRQQYVNYHFNFFTITVSRYFT